MSYFALLPGVAAGDFGEGSPQRARYMALVLAKSRSFQPQAGVPKNPVVVLVSATPAAGGLSVYTRVYFPPGQNAAAQGMRTSLLVPPGPQAAWLRAAWPGTELSLIKRWAGRRPPSEAGRSVASPACPAAGNSLTKRDFSPQAAAPRRICCAALEDQTSRLCNPASLLPCSVVSCDDSLCFECVNPATGAATRAKCSKCVASTGVPGQPGYASVYMKNDAKHTCALCTVPRCVRCGPLGTCATCAQGFVLNGGRCEPARAASAAVPATAAPQGPPAPREAPKPAVPPTPN